MKHLGLLVVLAIAGTSAAARSDPLIPQPAQPYGADLLGLVRRAATAIPGAQPSGISYVKVAESHRPLSEIMEGGSQGRYVSARTALQVACSAGSVMIEPGMGQSV